MGNIHLNSGSLDIVGELAIFVKEAKIRLLSFTMRCGLKKKEEKSRFVETKFFLQSHAYFSVQMIA